MTHDGFHVFIIFKCHSNVGVAIIIYLSDLSKQLRRQIFMQGRILGVARGGGGRGEPPYFLQPLVFLQSL